MRNRADSKTKKQSKSNKRYKSLRDIQLPPELAQMLMPLVMGVIETKQTLHSWVLSLGIVVMQQMFNAEAERVVGPKHKRKKDRLANHWGSKETTFEFGGREVILRCPRVRGGNQEIRLPMLEQLRKTDPIPKTVVEQILLGVSTRGYSSSLESPPPKTRTRNDSKSSASRHLIEGTEKQLKEFIEHDLSDMRLCAIMLDGIRVAKRSVIVALGIDMEGEKHPLGLRVGSTENATVCTELMHELLKRGLSITGKMLFVIDGGKGLRKAIDDVFGTSAVVQRCRNHKIRNVKEHLPKHRHAYIERSMRDAYKSSTAKTARKRLKTLVSWLENNGHDDASSSLSEGLEETLTVLKLGLPPSLAKSLATTNAIENLMGTIRQKTRNVKRWRNDSMVKRWTTMALVHAHSRFRRIRGYRFLSELVTALNGTEQLDLEAEAA